MIKYTLGCENGHDFESWFESADAFDKLAQNKLLTCVECGSSAVEKKLMAPRVRTDRQKATPPQWQSRAQVSAPQVSPEQDPKLAAAIDVIKKHVEENSRYVGKSFSKIARDMHYGDQKQEAIHGEATAQEAKALAEEGVSIVPLPFMPKQKLN